MLGYIRFVEDKGTLELTNFGAQLSRKSLDLGATSKRDKTHLAGTHGEGFKVAALVMARHGYQVRFEASSYYWSFRFGGPGDKHLYCHLTPISETKIKKQMKANRAETSQGFPRDLKANNWEDVTVRIGRLYGPQWGKRIEKQQFLSWVKVAIDLDQPPEFLRQSTVLLFRMNFLETRSTLKVCCSRQHLRQKDLSLATT